MTTAGVADEGFEAGAYRRFGGRMGPPTSWTGRGFFLLTTWKPSEVAAALPDAAAVAADLNLTMCLARKVGKRVVRVRKSLCERPRLPGADASYSERLSKCARPTREEGWQDHQGKPRWLVCPYVRRQARGQQGDTTSLWLDILPGRR